MWSLLRKFILPFLPILEAVSVIGVGRGFGWERACVEVRNIAERVYSGKIPLEDTAELFFSFHLLYLEAIDLVGKTLPSILESQNAIIYIPILYF